jgi:hypothetical protein
VRRLAFERRVRPVPVGEAEAPVDQLVPVLEVDREKERRLTLRGAVGRDDAALA